MSLLCRIASLLGLLLGCSPEIGITRAQVNEPSEFRLPTATGNIVSLEENTTAQVTVVCFLGVECPLARLYGPRLSRLSKRFQSRGVQFIGINSNVQDSMEELRSYKKEHGIEFPCAKDYRNVVADQFGATRTPAVFVLTQDLNVRYRGRIDDQYEPGISRQRPTRNDLVDAINATLESREIAVPVTEPRGCLIGRVTEPDAQSDITFCKQVARVLYKNCVECHRPGQIGPFSLLDYDEVVGWADMIVEVIDEGRMPPWHADPKHGSFSNARIMSEHDKNQIRAWRQAGAPLGDTKDLPDPVTFVEGWQLAREPEQIVSMRDRPFRVPAEGTVEYQYFVVDPKFEKDMWIREAQVIPGNPSVVHHAIVFVRPPDGTPFRGVGWISAYVPGQMITPLPPGRARHVPAGSKLVFQMHYTPTGKPQDDLTRIGLNFCARDEVTHQVYTLVGIDQEFEIPPHAADFAVHGTVPWLPDNAELLAIMPHMHLRGKSFELTARSGESRSTLLRVPRYDFNWQHVYVLENQVPLSDVEELEFTVTFDNSNENPVNPNPDQHVTWGDQTWEEMAVAFFEVSQPVDEAPKFRVTQPRMSDSDRNQKVDAFLSQFLKKFDLNKDGVVERSETPVSFRRFGFGTLDRNRDRFIDESEIRRAARRSFR